ncbi:hypothetical protein [Cupriavidus sp. IDO]|uniref:hypothetical protein n=1 Tax=Cupriavidus sp. IDO TaxID=1539142 RepID=UPI000691DD14|nr:hypothetical protein [Cupriavidus sp. IDO]KWR84228.1 hypothetical protein RM96_28015 [Cupriavidus sp. IDO]
MTLAFWKNASPRTVRRAHMWISGDRIERRGETYQCGPLFVEWETPEEVTRPWPIVLLHGGGYQGTEWFDTPDGRPGWAQRLVEAGYAVLVADRNSPPRAYPRRWIRKYDPSGCASSFVEPGPFRTAFLGRSITVARRQISDYDQTAGQRRAYRDSNDGKQAGDPTKAIDVILRAVNSDSPPLHLPLGPVGYSVADHKLAAFRDDIDAWRRIAIAADFD